MAGYPPGPASPVAVPRRIAARLAVAGLVGQSVLLVGVVLTRGAAGLVLVAAVALLALPAVLRGGPRMAAVRALPEVGWFLGLRPDPASTAGR